MRYSLEFLKGKNEPALEQEEPALRKRFFCNRLFRVNILTGYGGRNGTVI